MRYKKIMKTTKKRQQPKVQETKVAGKKCFGLTSDKLWFFYAYHTVEEATAMLRAFSTEDGQDRIRVNISLPQAMQIVDPK